MADLRVKSGGRLGLALTREVVVTGKLRSPNSYYRLIFNDYTDFIK